MSFKCDDCGIPQDPGTAPVRVVTETRKKVYVGGGVGHETVKEKNLCKPCVERHTTFGEKS